jgi:hypothetical protein
VQSSQLAKKSMLALNVKTTMDRYFIICVLRGDVERVCCEPELFDFARNAADTLYLWLQNVYHTQRIEPCCFETKKIQTVSVKYIYSFGWFF